MFWFSCWLQFPFDEMHCGALHLVFIWLPTLNIRLLTNPIRPRPFLLKIDPIYINFLVFINKYLYYIYNHSIIDNIHANNIILAAIFNSRCCCNKTEANTVEDIAYIVGINSKPTSEKFIGPRLESKLLDHFPIRVFVFGFIFGDNCSLEMIATKGRAGTVTLIYRRPSLYGCRWIDCLDIQKWMRWNGERMEGDNKTQMNGKCEYDHGGEKEREEINEKDIQTYTFDRLRR